MDIDQMQQDGAQDSELIDRSQRCHFCGVMAHVHHAADCPDPLFLAEPAPLDALTAFGGLLEAEWRNGNMPESTYLRLNADLHGVRLAAGDKGSDR